MEKLLKIILAIIFSFSFTFANNENQRILELQSKIQELERQEKEYKELIKQKQQESESLKKQLFLLENQIRKLKLEILATANKIEIVNLEINDLNKKIFEIKDEIERNKLITANLLRDLYDFEKKNFVAIIFANYKFSDFFNQIQYLNNLQDQLLSNLNKLKELKENFEDKKELEEIKKVELEKLNEKQRNQKIGLEGAVKLKVDILEKTKGEEAKFRQLLNETEKKKAQFYKELQKLEEEAKGRGVYIVRVKAASIPQKGKGIFKMPYDDFIITQGYGMTSFAKNGAYGGAPHNGIDLTSGFGSEIKAIGRGIVLAKGFNNAAGNWVAIKHDNDLVSVYGHLQNQAPVLVGEKIDENSIIGYEGATGYVTGSHLHLSLYHEFFTFIGPKTGQVYFNYWQGTLNPLDYIQI